MVVVFGAIADPGIICYVDLLRGTRCQGRWYTVEGPGG